MMAAKSESSNAFSDMATARGAALDPECSFFSVFTHFTR
jgi:hypothetical protein